MKTVYTLLVPLSLAACATTPPPGHMPADDIVRARLNQRVNVGGPYVTPLAVLEDSRCPMNARCVWAGRTRLTVKIDLGSRSDTREISSDSPIQVADGTLSLVEVQPYKMAGTQAKPMKYRFGFTFVGGI